jgi:hypothetical protein
VKWSLMNHSLWATSLQCRPSMLIHKYRPVPVILVLALIVAACGSDSSGSSGSVSDSGENAPSTYLALNQTWVEGLSASGLDLTDVDAVFWHVFSGLPDEVTVYPSENYFYFKLYVEGIQLWGNIRLAAGRREAGVLSFAYFEYQESPYVINPRVRRNKFFTTADGVILEELSPFKWTVEYKGRKVVFNFHELNQDPPNLFPLGENEKFVMRTFDESGYQFFLLFNTKDNYLFWVLNEEEIVTDVLQPLLPDYIVGRRSGFVFLVDKNHNDRKVLAAIRGANATVNNYYDGPFDQLADNYVDQTNITEYLVLSSPTLRGRLDKYGYFNDQVGSSRVAVSPYFVYFSEHQLGGFLEMINSSDDPYRTISKKGSDLLSMQPKAATPVP